MRFTAAALLVIGSMGSMLCAHAGELYRYVDESGRITYSDMPPPKSAKKVEKRAGADKAAEVALPYATREAAKKFPVLMYANDCGEPCALARQLLEKRGVPYTQKDPSTSKDAANALTKLVGALEVPTLVVGKHKHLKGFAAEAWNGALDEAGYPKTNPGVKPEQARRTEPQPATQGAAANAGTSTPTPPAVDPPAAAPSTNEAAKPDNG